jgi:nitrous oxide reductase accessory protein NosL
MVLLMALTLVATAFAAQDQAEHPSCPYCGMDRTKFAYSRVYLKYDDNSSVGTCSLHCAALEMALKIDKTPVDILVADFNTKELIDAETAVWVIGGSKMGVMTKRAKWAFGTKEAAEAFIKEFGGQSVEFNEVVKAAFEDMHGDVQMIREKRKMKGKKITLQAGPLAHVRPGPRDKCPVCGMFVAKYPEWVAEIRYQDQKTVFFDGAKDLFKYLSKVPADDSEQSADTIAVIFVTEYYSVELIDARKAFFVAGSNVYGPMGNELIPLGSRTDAEEFKKDHKGTLILTFDEVTPELIATLDE